MTGGPARLARSIGATSPARMRSTAALVLVLAVVVGALTAYSQAALRTGLTSIDRAARQAVDRAGSDADLLVQGAVGVDDPESGATEPVFPPDVFLQQAPGWASKLPAGLRTRLTSPSTVLVAPSHDAASRPGATDLSVVLAVPGAEAAPGLRAVAGRAAAAPAGGAVDVVVPRRAAVAAGLRIGSVLALQPLDSLYGDAALRIRVVGTVDPDRSASRLLGADLPGFGVARPQVAFGRPAGLAVTAFTTAAGAARAAAFFHERWTGVLRLRMVPGTVDAAAVPRIEDAVREAGAAAAAFSDEPVPLEVRSGFALALAPFPVAAATALGRQRGAIAGALVAGLVALLLLGGALATARRDRLLLERVRGLTGPGVLVRAAVESLVVAVPAAAIGAGLAAVAVPGPLQPVPIALVLVVAVLAPALAELRAAVPGAPAGRLAAVGGTLVVVLALLSVVVVQQGTTGPDDPLLVAAPVLVALAGAVVVVLLAKGAGPAVRPVLLRGRGAVGALAAVPRTGSGSGLAVAAVAVAAGVAVGGALLLADLDASAAAAAWRAVGADVRVTGALPPDAAAQVAGRPGVTAAAGLVRDRSAALVLDDASTPITLLGVDPAYPRLLATTPATPSAADAAALRALQAAPADGRLPVLVNPALDDRVGRTGTIEVAGRTVRVRVAGVLHAWPADDLARSGVVVGARALAGAADRSDARQLLLATGPGAAAATRGLPGVHRDRAAVLADSRALALPSGVATAVRGASVAAALLALLALLARLRSTAAARRREQALLAVLGLPGGAARRLLLLRTAPVVLAAVAAGAACGVASTRLLSPALGVAQLADVTAASAPVLPVLGLALLLAAAAVVLAVLLDPAGRAAAPAITALSTDGDPT